MFCVFQICLKDKLTFWNWRTKRKHMEKRTKQLEQNMPQYDFLLLLLLLFCWLLFHKEHSSHVTETPHYTNDIFTRLYTFQILSPVTIWQTDKCNTYQKTISQNIHFVDTSMCDGRIFCRRPLFHCVCVGTFKGVFKTKRGADKKGQKWKKSCTLPRRRKCYLSMLAFWDG